MKTLESAVRRQIGGKRTGVTATLREVAEHSADAGWPGFTYYVDTCAFTERNKPLIVDALTSDADDFGTCVCDMVAAFGCVKGNASKEEVEQYLLGGSRIDKDVRFLLDNALAWYALERVAHEVAS